MSRNGLDEDPGKITARQYKGRLDAHHELQIFPQKSGVKQGGPLLKEWIESQKDLREHREEDRIETENWGMCVQRGQVMENNRKILVLSLSLEKNCCAVSCGKTRLASRAGEGCFR